MSFIERVLEEIKKIRKEKKMSLDDVGSQLGVSATSYRKIEEGETELKVKTMLEIFNILGIRLDTIQGGTEEVIAYSRYDIDNFVKKDDIKKIESKIEKTESLLAEILKKLNENK